MIEVLNVVIVIVTVVNDNYLIVTVADNDVVVKVVKYDVVDADITVVAFKIK